jgi:CheY-like chemotaxis protein
VNRPHPGALDDASVPDPHFAGRVIVVVDDDQNLRDLLEVVLGLLGAKVITTGDSVHAAQMISFIQPDLVLLDVDMPVVDGWEVARRLRANQLTAAIPFMFVTGTSRIGQTSLRGAGASGVVRKPFDPELLETSIDAVLADQAGQAARRAVTESL